jgi:hypothetical protein
MAEWFDTAIKVIAVVACSAVALILVAIAINTIRILIEWLKDEE